MKKIILAILIGSVVVSMSGFASAMLVSGTDQTDEWSLEPYYILTESSFIKMLVDVRHDFGKVFSTDLSRGQLKALQIFGIKTEPVSIFRIVDTISCRNDKDCPSGYYCDKSNTIRGMGVCVLKDNGEDPAPEPEPERKCYPSTSTPWGISRVNGGAGGEGVKVAVLDTGIMQDHLDLKGRIVACESRVTRFVPDRKDCEDGHGHGTHVAGTILADAGSDGKGIYGVAPQAELIAIKVCDRQGRCYGDDIAAGINLAVEKGANIISMSFGGSSLSSFEKDAIDSAVEIGILVVAAAGNSGPDLNTINYPAAYHKVVSVAATDSSDTVANFSSRGIDAIEFKETEDRHMEVAAPGVSVESTNRDGCYIVWSGTSMATPHISGLTAKLWESNAENTRVLLQSLTQDITEGLYAGEGYDPASGFGLPVAPE